MKKTLLVIFALTLFVGCAIWQTQRHRPRVPKGASGFGGYPPGEAPGLVGAVWKTTNLKLNQLSRGHFPWDEEWRANNSIVDTAVGTKLKADGSWKPGAIHGIISVEEYGATGDGVTNDTATIQSAIDAAIAAGGATVYFPKGTYILGSPGLIMADVVGELNKPVILQGAGWKTVLQQNAVDGSNALTIGKNDYADDSGYTYSVIRDMNIKGNASSGHGIALLHARVNKVINCRIDYHGGDGIYCDDAWANDFVNCRIQSNTSHGINFDSDGNSCTVTNSHITGHNQAGKAGIRIVGSDVITISGCDIEGNTYGILVQNSEAGQSPTVIGCQFESNTTALEIQNDTGGASLEGPSITGCLFYADPVNIGNDDSASTYIRGGSFKGNVLSGAAAILTIAGDAALPSRVYDFEIGANSLLAGATYNVKTIKATQSPGNAPPYYVASLFGRHRTGAGNTEELRLGELDENATSSIVNYIAHKAPDALAASYTFIEPNGVGTSGQVLTTDGANPATLTWTTPSGTGDMLKATYDANANGDIDVAAGGTEKSSWTQYCIPYLSATTTFGEIPIGAEGKYLKVSAGATGYEWDTPAGGGGLWSNNGTIDYLTTTTNDVAIGANAPDNSAKLSIHGDADQVQLNVRMVESQTALPVVVEDSVGTDILTVSPAGIIAAATWQGNEIADAYVSDTLTVGSGGSVDDAAIPAGITRDSELSAWTGSTNIATLGTITAGTWNGTSIADANVDNNITLDNITQITNRSHTSLTDIGTNTHAQIDTHIADTSDPHGATLSQTNATLSGVFKILENGAGPTLYGIFDVADLNTADKTYTFPDLTGTVAMYEQFDTQGETETIWGTTLCTDAELAAWTGSANIVTLGTIATGTWNATEIADGKIPAGITRDTELSTHASTTTGVHGLTIATPVAGHLLLYNGTGTDWQNKAMSGDATITDAGVVAVADDSHAHTTTTISGLDISADTNLAVTAPVVLTDDTLSVSAASDTASGVSELATAVETTTGTDATRAVTPDGLAGSGYGEKTVYIKVLLESTTLTTGDGKAYVTIPDGITGWNLVDADAAVYTVSSSGTPTIQIHNLTDTVDMLSTLITIDVSEYSSYTAATPPVINGAADDVATGDRLRIDVDVAGTGTAGLDVILVFQLP